MPDIISKLFSERHQESDLQKSVVSFSPDASKLNAKNKKAKFYGYFGINPNVNWNE